MCTGEQSWVSLWAALGMAGERGDRDSPAGQCLPILLGLTSRMGVGCGKGTAGENFAPCSLGQAYPGTCAVHECPAKKIGQTNFP